MHKRKYAAFFEWHDKARKELGVVEKLLRFLGVIASATCYHSRQLACVRRNDFSRKDRKLPFLIEG